MSDETTPGATPPEASQETASEAAAAWRAVVAELDQLGDALGRWVKAATSDPENKRRLDELSARLEGFVSDVGATVKGATEGEVGQQFKEAAVQTGEAFKSAGEKVAEEVGPRLAGAFKTMGDKLRGAAEKMEERQSGAASPDADASPDAPDTSAGPSA
jgi:predicted transcriptional regulator